MKDKGIFIPREVWEDGSIKPAEKMLYGLILSHETELGCDVGNKQLAEELRCSESTISKTIAKLKAKGLLTIISFDGRKRVVMTN